MSPDSNDLKVARDLGALQQSIKDLSTHFTNHLSDHGIDRIMQWFIIGLQVVVIMAIGAMRLF